MNFRIRALTQTNNVYYDVMSGLMTTFGVILPEIGPVVIFEPTKNTSGNVLKFSRIDLGNAKL